jgi:hypothetical protein
VSLIGLQVEEKLVQYLDYSTVGVTQEKLVPYLHTVD